MTPQELVQLAGAESERAQKELRALESLIQQHRNELDGLARRDAAINQQLHQLRQIAKTGFPDEARAVYESALHSREKLFTIRGQLEKLQSQRECLARQATHMNAVLEVVGGTLPKVLHDEIAPPLTNCVLQAEIIQRLYDRNPEQARIELQNLGITIRTAIQRVRDLITDLRPLPRDDLSSER